jgi:hypothetical protein
LKRCANSCVVDEEPRVTIAINDDVIKLLLLRCFLLGLADFGLLTNYLQLLAPISASVLFVTLFSPRPPTVELQELIMAH